MFFEKLKLFNSLIEMGSFSKLADNYNLSLSYVSRKISSLEEEIGHKLIVRNFKSGPIKLTHPGEILYKSLPVLIGSYESVKNLMGDDPNIAAGTLNIYTTASVIEDWLVPMLPIFKEKLPKVKINCITEDYLIDRKVKNSVVSITPYNPDHEDLIQIPLLDFHSALWASEKYLKRYGEPQNIEDLQRHQFLSFTKDFIHTVYPTLNWHLNAANVPLENITCINTTEGLVRATNEGLGILSLSVESIAAKGYKFKRILPGLKGPIITMCFTFPNYWKDSKTLNEAGKIIQNFFKTRNTENQQQTIPL